jgi:peroxiredoxin (alkyl hydroperoxide reductase subunit C)
MFFTLSTTDGLRRYPADFQNRWTLLFYYAGDFLPVSATELWGLAELSGDFRQKGCEILCISPDSVAVHLAFLENLHSMIVPPNVLQ